MKNDLTLFTQLDELSGIANQLCERIEDTKMLAGSEACASALSLYKTFESVPDDGVTGTDSIVEQLKNVLSAIQAMQWRQYCHKRISIYKIALLDSKRAIFFDSSFAH
jgi:hypothetical protein